MLDQRMYTAQIAALQHDHTTSVADITGAESVQALAAGVLQRAPAKFALVGLSMGGIIALHMVAVAPERITHLALLDTTPHVDLPERSALRIEQIARVEEGGLQALLRHSMKPLYLAARNRKDTALLSAVMDMGLALGPDVFRRQSLALRNRPAITDVLGAVRCPALVLCGREDILCSVDVHVAMAGAIESADLLVLADTGHLSAMESPHRVSAAILDLLARTH